MYLISVFLNGNQWGAECTGFFTRFILSCCFL